MSAHSAVKFGSLFSGVGGFDLGFQQAGLECAWQVEIDKDCQRVLGAKFPNVERYEDVTKIGRLAAVDVICGGFPCQDLSVAGKRAGLAGGRSGLWFQFLRIIGINKPRWIVIENVPGLLSSDEGRDFAIILRGLVECGYCLAWRIVDAQFYGVAQRRRRVFIVGSLGDGSAAEILFESESVSWNPPTRGEAGPGVAATVRGGTASGSNEFGNKVAGTLSADYGKSGGNGMGNMANGMIAATLDQRGRGPTERGQRNNGTEQNYIAMPLKAKANSSHDESHETYVVAEALRAKRPGEGGIAGDDTHIVAASLMGHSGLHDSGGQQTFVTHALRSEGADASEDGTGRGTPLIIDRLEHHRFHCLTCDYWFGVNDYEERIVTCPNCGETHIDKITDALDYAEAVDVRNLRMQPDGTSGTLQGKKSGGYSLNYQNPICFSSKDHGADAGEIAPTLRSQNFKDSHMNGGGQAAIAFCTDDYANMTFEETSVSRPLTNSPDRSRAAPIASNTFGVRRLTPRECERLQGFPDDWTLYDASGKEISDSARYRTLGNAVCVNVARWIGRRLRVFT